VTRSGPRILTRRRAPLADAGSRSGSAPANVHGGHGPQG